MSINRIYRVVNKSKPWLSSSPSTKYGQLIKLTCVETGIDDPQTRDLLIVSIEDGRWVGEAMWNYKRVAVSSFFEYKDGKVDIVVLMKNNGTFPTGCPIWKN